MYTPDYKNDFIKSLNSEKTPRLEQLFKFDSKSNKPVFNTVTHQIIVAYI